MTQKRAIVCLLCLFTLASRIEAYDGDSMVRDAHQQLDQALTSTGDEQLQLLKTARETLENLPPGVSQRHRGAAVGFIKSAIFALKHGDPDHRALEYIRNADEEARDCER